MQDKEKRIYKNQLNNIAGLVPTLEYNLKNKRYVALKKTIKTIRDICERTPGVEIIKEG